MGTLGPQKNGQWLITNCQCLTTGYCSPCQLVTLSRGIPTMPQLRPGQPAPDITLSTLDDHMISLSAYWGDDYYLWLIFLRHLA